MQNYADGPELEDQAPGDWCIQTAREIRDVIVFTGDGCSDKIVRKENRRAIREDNRHLVIQRQVENEYRCRDRPVNEGLVKRFGPNKQR